MRIHNEKIIKTVEEEEADALEVAAQKDEKREEKKAGQEVIFTVKSPQAL